ncbi:hypothetical protein ACPPVQ_05875 [Diaminobutyricibacter sp. McL0618]|uniref:hypothetical protein n=1 Tax=Leifsonia sp. McL0618 TaxID=3415677 RepID=UPI003CEB9224
MSESEQSRRPSIAALAMAGTFITVAAAIGTIVWSSMDSGLAGLSDFLMGLIPTAIIALGSSVTAFVALVERSRPRWIAVTALVISGVLGSLSGFIVLAALMQEGTTHR